MRPQDINKYNELKNYMTYRVWTPDTSTYKDLQMQGITQGFRIVGSMCKTVPDKPLVAFKSGEKWKGIDDLAKASYMNEMQKTLFAVENKVTIPIAEAKKKFPKWYQRTVVDHKPQKQWFCHRGLYDWWLQKITEERPLLGHRFFRIMCLSIYAIKCGVFFDELEKDAYGLYDHMNEDIDEPFEYADIEAALKIYQASYAKITRKKMESISAIKMPANKRNGRTLAVQIKIACAVRNVLYPDGEWRDKSKTYKKKVSEYRLTHPDEKNKSKVARELNLARKTVIKHWNAINEKIV
jgi:hypothetical protein